MDWHAHWNTMPGSVAEDDLLRQVGKTVGGQPVPEAAVEAMVSDIRSALRLAADDSLLDLCCGNGLLTARCAEWCLEATGVDFSAPLIRVAQERCSRPNVTYVLADVSALPARVVDRPYSKILMYEAIQHLAADEVERLLRALRGSASRDAMVLIGSIPNRDRLWSFYDTDDRRREYARRVSEGTEAIGRWWTQSEIAALGARCGYTVALLPQHPDLHTAHYRFDGLLTPARAHG